MAATRGYESELTITACLQCSDRGAVAAATTFSAPSPKRPGLGSTRMKLPNFKVRDREARSPAREGACAPRSYANKRGLQLDRVVLLGRTFDEYRRYFLLQPHELIGKRVLDVAGGVSSFCAEANNLGIKVTAFDPIYSLSLEKIRERSDPDLESVYQTIGRVPTYRWGLYKNPDYMRTLRERASNIFSRISKFIRSLTLLGSCRDYRLVTASLI